MINYDQYALDFINKLDLKKTAKDEHHGSCPNCGGDDRFWIKNFDGQLIHNCRHCEFDERQPILRELGLIPESLSTSVPYHQKKNIPLLDGAKLDGDVVKVPISELKTGNHLGHQKIRPNGEKRYSTGMKKDGAGCFIGEKSNILYVCEGWATAVAIHKATGEQALFALDAKTMVKTVKDLDHPNIIIAADHDEVGIEAAKATGLPYALPENDGWDWWDAYNTSGIEVVKKQLKSLNGKNEFTLEGYEFLTGSELASETYEPIEYLYPDIIPTPNLVLLAGAPKLGKSWFAFLLIDKLTEKNHRVVYLANEDSNERLQKRYTEVVDFPSDKILFLGGLSNDKKIPKGKNAHLFIRAIKQKHDPKVIIIDTMAAIRSANQKDNYNSIEDEFSAFRHLAHELDITIICVHHTKKKTDYEIEPLDSILGSQAIAGTVETVLVMQKIIGTKNVSLFVTGKDVEEQDLTLPWRYPGYSEPVLSSVAELGSAQIEVLSYIKDHPRCTQASIVNELGKSKAQVSEICGKLITKDLIRKYDQGLLVCTE